ncbi:MULTISPECIES: hypothetical protein [Paracoccaceae]|jgi:hypothetical protein|uniref:hypothetical protein n=1 Tax=Rhodobacterales TaxID=204455 RepID=UPI001B0B7F6E|nr:hypothetical protein [Boseongicola sp. H5]MBO6602712.1 hypothetical protein [Roseicyclus sp.]MBO6623943.1 hypothetical protein [Roseicyclus sp.]MBO6923048.1 hypothetical protein [Roseicyclus sp.]
MKSALSLQNMVRIMDRTLMPDATDLVLQPVCLEIEADVGVANMDQDEARQIMAEIDAKSSALLAVLAIILATSAFIFSLDQRWLTLLLMFAQIVSISVSILFLLRCLIYEPSPRLRHVFELDRVADAFYLQIEAIKQVRYFNRVIVLTVVTCVLFFAMSMIVGIDAMM